MNTQKMVLGSVIIGSLVGLCLGLHYYLKEESKEEPTKEKDGKKKQARKESAPGASKVHKDIPRPELKKEEPASLAPEMKTAIEKKLKIDPLTPLPQIEKPRLPETEQPVEKDQDDFPLRLGSKGPRVERLNVWLMRNFGWTGVIGDEYDHTTEKQVQRFMKLDQIDQKTFERMKMARPVFEQKIVR